MKNSFSLIVIGALVLVGALVVGYTKGGYKNTMGGATVTPQNSSSSLPPAKEISLTISSPANGATVTSPTVTVRGKTVPKADVSVNDKDVVADANGNFSAIITLDDGENTIVVVASDANGNNTEKELAVTYNSGQ